MPVSSVTHVNGERDLASADGGSWRSGLAACFITGLAIFTAMQLPATGLAGGGDRTISFANMHTKETLTVTYVRNGRHVPEALKKINHMLRDWRRNEAIEMDPEGGVGANAREMLKKVKEGR